MGGRCVRRGGLTLVIAFLAIGDGSVVGGPPSARILSRKVLCKQVGRYIGWPSIAQAPNGDLIAVFSGDRSAHVSEDGKEQMVRSTDGGETWGGPITIFDSPIDDRDSGILRTSRGTMIVSWFTGPPYWTPLQGHYIVRSVDSGFTWGDPIRTPVTTPHGPIQLRSGRLLYLGLEPHSSHTIPMDYNGPPAGSPHKVSIAASDDDGLTWRLISHFPVPADALMLSYDEPQMVELPSGRLIAMFRDNNSPQRLIQSESDDGGLTWSTPHRTPIQGYPPHIIRLGNGWLLVSYAKRWDPLGEYACISRDDGETWDVEHEIRLTEAWSGDIGYPASIQVADGSIWTVAYEADQPGETPSLIGVHWRLDADECSQALAATEGFVGGTTAFAAPGGPSLCGQVNTRPDVWFTWMANCTGTAVVAACGAGANMRLAVYSGTCEALTEIACERSCGSRICSQTGACLQFDVNAGQTYVIRVATDDSDGQDFTLQIACGAPVNETCATAAPVIRGTRSDSTLTATADAEGACGAPPVGPDVWYAYTAGTDGILRLSTCGSMFDTVLSVFDTCGGTELACNDNCPGDPCGGVASCVNLPVQKGRTYPIRVAGSGGARGAFQLTIRDGVIAVHEGATDPATEGWERNDFTGVGGTVGPGTATEPHWWTRGNAGGAQRYLYTLTPEVTMDPSGWTYTVRARVSSALSVFEAAFGVIERGDWWSLHLVAGETPESIGAFLIDTGANQGPRLSPVDPRSGYHTYQIVYDPLANSGTGGVTYYLDGEVIGTRARGQGYHVPGMTRLDFGDIDRGSAPSDSQWSLVKFETGQHPIRPPQITLFEHKGATDPTTESWTLDDFTGIGGSVGGGRDSEEFWRTVGNAGAAQRYLMAIDPAVTTGVRGWTYTARVKANVATSVFDASFGVIERGDWWNLHLVTGTSDARGVWVIDANAQPGQRLSAVDPGEGYHTYQILYEPGANSGAGGVTYFIDGMPIGKRARGQQFQVAGVTRLDFGDIDRGVAASDSQWSLVRFDIGNTVVCSRPFADADRDGDVDMDDFAVFQGCYTGPGRRSSGACHCFDHSADGAIDATEFMAFKACASGPGVPANTACAQE